MPKPCWEFPNLVVSNLVVCNFCAEALVCAFLRPFALFCALLRTCKVCPLLRSIALFLGGSKQGWFSKRGFRGCSPGMKTGTRVHSDVPPERKPERGYVRMFPGTKTGTRVHSPNHPFTKPPLCLPLTVARICVFLRPTAFRTTAFGDYRPCPVTGKLSKAAAV